MAGTEAVMNYPPVTMDRLLPLVAVKRELDRNPNYLDTSPWSQEVRKLLRDLFLVEDSAPLAVVDDWNASDPEAWDDVATKARQLYAELEKAQLEAETGEVVQIIKAKAGLLERLIAVGDKSMGHKKVAEFTRTMHAIMEEVLTPDQRTRVIEMMGSH